MTTKLQFDHVMLKAELLLTVSSSQVRGHEGPQLLNTVPEMSEH